MGSRKITFSISRHGAAEWCHVCGRRRKLLVDVFYQADARGARAGSVCNDNIKHLRACDECVHSMAACLPEGT